MVIWAENRAELQRTLENMTNWNGGFSIQFDKSDVIDKKNCRHRL